MRPWASPMRAALLALGCAVGLAAAGMVTGCGKGANAPGRDAPAYTGHAVDLFDDGVDPIAVGYQLDPGPAPATDAKLRERVQTADAVVRARVVTVTSKREESGRSWQLGLEILDRLAGSGSLDNDFSLEVEATDPGAGMVRAFDTSLVGRTFVVAVRSFARPGGAGEIDQHFHISADRPDVLAAVKDATLLAQVR